MEKVNKKRFFDYVSTRDITPWSERMKTIWKNRSGNVVGETTPGYLCEGEKSYWLMARRSE